jgi:amino acid adenylation domain-containing protein
VVGIAMERSAAAVVAVLAVLEAGAAYLPLDTHHPAERLAFMLDDADARIVLVAHGDAAGALPESIVRIAVELSAFPPFEKGGQGGFAVAVAGEGNGNSKSPSVPLFQSGKDDAIDGDALAYVMYTSGSTGVPKGVEIRHRSILRLVVGSDFMQLTPDTRMLHAAPLGFDASTLELWGPLLNGGCVVVHDEALPTGAGLAATIARHGVTGAWLTAALFNAVVDDDPRQLAGLRELFTGGEALSVDHVRRMLAAAPGLRLCNGYGPTECTTFTTTYAIPADLPADTASIPIGRPIADTQLYVLNARGEPLPAGVIGELYIGGEGLARGYLKRPELTAERFVPNPFGVPGERLYRTGDHVRLRDDGVVEFVGRVDDQVKIRGFRIELSEIEAVLSQHPGVRACAVLARADTPGDKRLVAYVVAEGATPPAHALRAHLAATLPEFMVPARYVMLDAMPVTANGKLDRRALPAPDQSRPELAAAYEPPVDAVERALCAAFAALLDIDAVGRHDNFFELGGNSLLAVRLVENLRGEHAIRDCLAADAAPIATTLLFRHPAPAAFAAALRTNADADDTEIDPARLSRGRRDAAGGALAEPIAIIAMAGRFPGAHDVEAFWRNLCDGRDSITFFKPEELDPSIAAAERDALDYVAARGVIDGVEDFDAAFFGISAREAELMDPQQRIFLELCWECLERGGHAPDATTVPVGVFAGMYNATYYQRHLAARPDLIAKIGAFQVMLGNEKDYITTRVAHKLDLTGPTVSVHSACSTSLVAICQAVDSLRAGRCGMALAGGASVNCPPRSGYLYQEGSMLSPDGRTRTFDADAQGTVFSDGAAVVLLKRLSDAIADGNEIYAVIRGAAVNNDGARKASFSAPSAEAQAAVVAMAHADAGVDPRDISYVETHGTATPLGDPIEIEGLRKAFKRGGDDKGYCRIGSLKSNVGHMVIAAGASGVIKTALSLHERRIPANLHFNRANPALGLDDSPFVVNDALHDWNGGGTPRLAGVSSFGVGGTNAHVVLEEAPPLPASGAADGPQLLVLSARTPSALGAAASRLADHLDAAAGTNLADVAWTLAVGRKAFAHRLAICARDAADAATQLRAADTARSRAAQGSEVVFLFPGQGAQYAGMGRELYAAEPAFRAAFDECAGALRGEAGFDSASGRSPGSSPGRSLHDVVFGDAADALLPTAVMQPSIFAIEYSLAKLWMSLGVQPAAMAGHSVGEFVAATLAGVFALPDAMRLVARRGRLMQAQAPGGMLSVRLPFDDIARRLPEDLSLAAENAPGSCVVAGPFEPLAAFQAQLEADGVACRALRTSHAFHSAMMDAVVAPFRDAVASVARSAPRLPIVSTVSADWLDAETAMSADYWARHLREPVRFAAALGRMLQSPSRTLLEVGPRTTLATLARQHPQTQKQDAVAIASLADAPTNEVAALRLAAGQLWCRGAAIDPAAFDRRGVRRRVRLPTYPFERQRYWVEAAVASRQDAGAGVAPGCAPAKPATSDLLSNKIPLQQAVIVDAAVESVMQQAATAAPSDRKPRLIAQLKDVFEDIAGFDIADADAGANFIELGLDSLMLTQVALQLQKQFPVKISFRQLMGECASLDRLAAAFDAQLPAEAPVAAPQPATAQATPSLPAAVPSLLAASAPPEAALSMAMPAPMPLAANAGDGDFARQLIAQQMQLMSQQLALLSGAQPMPAATIAAVTPMPARVVETSAAAAAPQPAAAPAADEEEAALAHTRYDVKKAFGAIARIDNSGRLELTLRQRAKLDAFIERYVARTRKSKDYTTAHRAHMADPRVVNGFRPLLKEITYQIVIERSKGAHLTDLDGNDYVDALNGFGMSLFGWQPDFVLDAVRQQLDLGYEIGPQHPLAGEVAKLVCDVTGHDRAALCNTGSEAVLGALRIARTVTGRETVVLFTGAYHGIVDEMIVRGTKKLRAVPAAPGILRNTAEHVLVLDYGTPESMAIIRERASEIAAVLVEPVQSRRPDFRPVEFLRELREVTEQSGSLLIFDEVVTGFRAHPAGAQGLFGIRADLGTYGKVVGGGYPIGVIAGSRAYMDALDGGHWQFGDDSVPTVGVTYFAGTFVRHPLALAAAKAVLGHIKAQGPQLQEKLNARVQAMAEELNAFCSEAGAPIEVRQFASVWKTFFLEDHPLQDLLFAMMRSRGVHILDNFPCFLTTAHGEADFQRIIRAFKESVTELQESEFLPRRTATARTVMDQARPAVPGARLGRDPDGRPAWFVPNPDAPGKYLKVG